MSTAPELNRFAPPVARVDDLESTQQQFGSRWARLGAVIIDGLIQGAIFYGLAFTVFPFLRPDLSGRNVFANLPIQLGATVVIFALLQSHWLNKYGQTIGKRLLGLRIVRSDGSPASLARLLGLRYLLSWVLTVIPFVGGLYGLVDALLIFRASHKCLHDNIADTIVIKA